MSMMRTITVELPQSLVEQLQGRAVSEETLKQVMIEAALAWATRKPRDLPAKERALQVLRETGLIMTPERQRVFAEAVRATLPSAGATRHEVKQALSKLKTPLSEEIIAERDERW